jgi:hypothetical protein
MSKRKLGIILPTKKSPTSEYTTTGKSVVSGIGSNPTIFANPVVPMKDLDEATKAVEAAILPELKQSRETDLILETKKAALLVILNKLANYVLLIANGDRMIAELSGFKLTKETSESQDPSALELKKTSIGANPGTAQVVLKDRAGAAFFLVMLKDIHGEFKIIDGFNTLDFIVLGLPSGESTLRIYGKKNEKVSPTLDVLVRAM